MSQMQTFGIAGLPPTGPIATLTADLPAAPGNIVVPDAMLNINVLANNQDEDFGFAVFTADVAANTLSLEPLTESITTIDATTTTIFSLFMPTSSAATIRARIVGIRDDYSNFASGDIIVVGRRAAVGNVAGLSSGQLLSDYAGNPPPTAGGGANATELLVRVRGIVGETWNWTAAIMYQFNL